MISKIHIQNYKCLLDVEIELGPFNVFIGPNDSGKTSVLDAIQMLGKADPPPDLQSLVWERRADRQIALEVWGDPTNPFFYRLQLSTDSGVFPEILQFGSQEFIRIGVDPQQITFGSLVFQPGPNKANLWHILPHATRAGALKEPSVSAFMQSIQSTRSYTLDPEAMRLPAAPEANPTLDTRGKNLAAVVQGLLTGPDRRTVTEIENKLHDAIPGLRGLFTPLDNGQPPGKYRVDFTLDLPVKRPVSIPSSQVSDGAILLLGFLVLAYGETPLFLMIEEPENGLHPSRLKKVIETLRKMSTGEIGNRPRQIILTTHSPLLLNYVKPEEVQIFRRDPELGTQVKAMKDVPNIERLQREYAPGELWYLFGEDDLVKGPAA